MTLIVVLEFQHGIRARGHFRLTSSSLIHVLFAKYVSKSQLCARAKFLVNRLPKRPDHEGLIYLFIYLFIYFFRSLTHSLPFFFVYAKFLAHLYLSIWLPILFQKDSNLMAQIIRPGK